MGTDSMAAETTGNFDAAGYVKRVGDLDKPLPLDSPFFLPPRPDNSPPKEEPGKKKQARKLPTPLSGEEKEKLKAEYYKNVQLPATTTLYKFSSDCITEVLPGQAWVVPGLLSEEECEQLVEAGEEAGLEKYGTKSTGLDRRRTSKRTDNYYNE